MSIFRKISGHLTVNTLVKTFLVLGFFLILSSLIFPFYYAKWIAVLAGSTWSDNYWSYMAIMHSLTGVFGEPLSGSQVFLFYQYWSGGWGLTDDIQSMLLPMFEVQLLTLVFALVPIRFSRRPLLLAPVLSGSVVAALMTYAGEKISGDTEALSGAYQPGYYPVFAAIAMFLSAFVLNEVTKNRARARAEIDTYAQSNAHSHV
jgi:glucan phosphoethanolaminetransferase (alkaline phosphatase superfamily)